MYSWIMYPNNDSLQSFNQEISLFVEWWEQNYREINVNKTKELIVDYRQNKTFIPATAINGQSVGTVSEYKYLGTVIDEELKFDVNTKCKIGTLQ